MSARYAHAGQFTRRNKQIRFLKVRVGRVIRDIGRTIAGDPALVAHFAENPAKAEIIMSQALTPKAKEKIHSWHAAVVECIGKGKARTRYEFGCKATITTINGRTNARAKGGVFVLHMDALHGKPHDGHTLGNVLAETASLTGVTPSRVYVDKGYSGHKQGVKQPVSSGSSLTALPAWKVYMSGKKPLQPREKKELKRRSAIEPIIGHLKSDHRMGRNFLKGKNGDRFNARMAAIGFNFRRILAWFKKTIPNNSNLVPT